MILSSIDITPMKSTRSSLKGSKINFKALDPCHAAAGVFLARQVLVQLRPRAPGASRHVITIMVEAHGYLI